MGRFFVLPYKMASEGGKMLADGLEGLRIRLENSEYRYQDGDCIVNWGTGDGSRHIPSNARHCLLNPDVNICINKKLFFERMQEHSIVPPFAFSRDEALRHLPFPIICRTRVEGADGQGIVIANNSDELVNAPLYTQLMDKTAEYRVHMGRRFDGEIVLICAQKKRLASGRPDNPVWTGEQVFLDWCDPPVLPRPVFEKCKHSMELMPELHFGGFDVIVTDTWGARVVEVNSAPMMTPETTRKYVEFFKRYVDDRDCHVGPQGFEEDPTETEDYQRGYTEGRQAMWEILQRCWQENNL